MKKLSAITLGVASVMLMSGCHTTPHSQPVNYSNVAMTKDTVSPEARRGMAPPSTSQPAPTQAALPPTAPVAAPAPARASSELIRITAVGYGAEIPFEGMTPGQRRLMAIRASKLDAYRSLAEQLYGISIDSNTSVASLAAQNDSFRARVNSTVRGARVISITPMADNNYETVMEVFVDRQFFDQVFVKQQDESPAVITPNQVR
ncbi:hypothetical protein THIAE_01945 [Thiomicrospira aerophila AL3]|uniref:Lipoprotein LPP20-like domain-containing protein n=1 Tax=Thiomicrospira aerophila AL3 TaxID=717772 RepID=W0DQI0_9GAMM|nr:LPP20 family lipoprotein [Thiomicrospira aerophila]AHF00692.1 hypothetical protein THIAE_01945 [Thiomicrospira aerophila AL3]